jgi:hypothetical protein
MEKKNGYVRFTVDEIWKLVDRAGGPEEQELMYKKFQAEYHQCGECGIVTDGIARQCRWCGCAVCVECDDLHEKMPEEYDEFYDDYKEERERIWESKLPQGCDLYDASGRKYVRKYPIVDDEIAKKKLLPGDTSN